MEESNPRWCSFRNFPNCGTTVANTETESLANDHVSENEISTNLQLNYNGSQIIKKRKMGEREHRFHDFLGPKQGSDKPVDDDLVNKKLQTERIKRILRSFRFYSREDEEEEKSLGVSTKLKLFEDPWKIKKTLTGSDVNDLCRLLLGTKIVKDHITSLWDDETIAKVETEEGVKVTLWDYDTGSSHQLLFKKWWKSSKSYVFTDNWVSRFVARRSLKVGDEIGLFWDSSSSRFGFRVLARAATHVQTKS